MSLWEKEPLRVETSLTHVPFQTFTPSSVTALVGCNVIGLMFKSKINYKTFSANTNNTRCYAVRMRVQGHQFA